MRGVYAMDMKKILEQPEYKFLKEDKNLGDNIILLVLGGLLCLRYECGNLRPLM